MINITLPPDIEDTLIKEAQRQGTTPELLALDSLRKLFRAVTEPKEESTEKPFAEEATLADFLAGYIGTVAGSKEAFSE